MSTIRDEKGARPHAASVDAGDIARFERLGQQWWDPYGPMKALHKLNPVRVGWITELACAHFMGAEGRRHPDQPKPLAGLNIVEIGSGGGLLCEPLALLGAQMTGIDPAAGNISIAATHAQQQGISIDYRATTVEDLAATGAQYDIVLAMEVIEHVNHVEDFMARCCDLVRPDGLIFVATLNRTVKSFALAIVGAEFILRWLPIGTHQWEKFVTPQELRQFFIINAVDVMEQSGVIYHPLRDMWRLSRDMDVNYMMAGHKPAAP
jgi:2-polyprenyl-6-hydroxyphenyl methylase / 3-demethylubiquinone-9 3-methyltransferase